LYYCRKIKYFTSDGFSVYADTGCGRGTGHREQIQDLFVSCSSLLKLIQPVLCGSIKRLSVAGRMQSPNCMGIPCVTFWTAFRPPF